MRETIRVTLEIKSDILEVIDGESQFKSKYFLGNIGNVIIFVRLTAKSGLTGTLKNDFGVIH